MSVSSTCRLTRGTDDSCGYDIVYTGKDIIITNTITELNLGCSISVSGGYICKFEARSSYGLQGLKITVNSYDLIDGKNIILYCFSAASNEILIRRGTRFAQLIIVPACTDVLLPIKND